MCCVVLQSEVPYSCEVVINDFKDKTSNLSVIDAVIIVSRETQKLILIGKQGMKLKELGSSARERLEKVSHNPFLYILRDAIIANLMI